MMRSAYDTIQNAFTGGFVNPQLGSIDLNGDGLKDILVFEKSDKRLFCFMATGKGDKPYQYAPQLQHLFPKGASYYFLIDFNHDKKPDIATYAVDYGQIGDNTAMRIYKNVSTKDSIKFELYFAQLPVINSKGRTLFSTNSQETPVFHDVDGDGDLDLLQINVDNTNSVIFYRNRGNEYGRLDTLDLVVSDMCWGRFTEHPAEAKYYLNRGDCDQRLAVRSSAKAHAGSTLFVEDLDGDGDCDLVIGDVGSSKLTVLMNGRISANHNGKTDSFISQNKFFPPDNPIQLPTMPLVNAVDIDNDGDSDIVITPAEISAAVAQHNYSWYYENRYDGFKPVYIYRQSDWLESLIADYGRDAMPVFYDMNGDGLKDLLIGAYGHDKVSDSVGARVLYFVQKRTPSGRPAFIPEIRDLLGIVKEKYQHLAPAPGIISDDDTIPDMLAGNEFGNIMYFKGGLTKNKLNYTLVSEALNYEDNGVRKRIAVGGYAYPALFDVDGDGRPDLLLGSAGTHTLRYYRHAGFEAGGAPYYEKVTDTFAGIKLPPHGFISSKNLKSAIGDIDGDGKQDIIIGNNFGEVYIYYDFLNADNSAGGKRIITHDGRQAADTIMAGNVAPALADLDKDGKMDIMLGTARGGLIYLGSRPNSLNEYPKSKIASPASVATLPLSVYPNPARNTCQLSWNWQNAPATARVRIYSAGGRIVHSASVRTLTGDNHLRLDLSNHAPGVYYIILESAAAAAGTASIVVLP